MGRNGGVSRPQLWDAERDFISSFLPEYGPYPENLGTALPAALEGETRFGLGWQGVRPSSRMKRRTGSRPAL